MFTKNSESIFSKEEKTSTGKSSVYHLRAQPYDILYFLTLTENSYMASQNLKITPMSHGYQAQE